MSINFWRRLVKNILSISTLFSFVRSETLAHKQTLSISNYLSSISAHLLPNSHITKDYFSPLTLENEAQLIALFPELVSDKNFSYIDPDVIEVPCKELVDKFKTAALNFTDCAISNSIPPNVCLSCWVEWIYLTNVYLDLKNGDDLKAAQDGETCRDLIFHDFLVSYIRAFYEGMNDRIWVASRCSDCVNIATLDNRTLEWRGYNNKTSIYMEKLWSWRQCRINVYNTKVNASTPHNVTHQLMCDGCWEQYEDYYDYYWDKVTGDEDDSRFCVDVESHMNHSAWVWRNLYECKRPLLPNRGTQAWAVGLVAAFFFVATILFYVGSFVQGEKRERELKKYSKMKPSERRRHYEMGNSTEAESFNNPSYSGNTPQPQRTSVN